MPYYDTDTAAITSVTIAAQPGRGTRIRGLGWSYDADPPASAALEVSNAAASETYAKFFITAGGPGFIPLTMTGKVNAGIKVTLSAGGAGEVSTLMVFTDEDHDQNAWGS